MVLRGRAVVLEPLGLEHLDALTAAGAYRSIWRWLPSDHTEPAAMRAFVDDALALGASGVAVPFAIVDAANGTAIGSTRYHYIEPVHRRLEIGFTWITPAYQRTAANTETKLLLLRHAFETLRYRRVEFKVDAENERSRAAVLRLGAREEGYFRQHMLYPDGRNRDSVYFSIVDGEWPAIEALLERKLGNAF